jgi:hypothetical protein
MTLSQLQTLLPQSTHFKFNHKLFSQFVLPRAICAGSMEESRSYDVVPLRIIDDDDDHADEVKLHL